MAKHDYLNIGDLVRVLKSGPFHNKLAIVSELPEAVIHDGWPPELIWVRITINSTDYSARMSDLERVFSL